VVLMTLELNAGKLLGLFTPIWVGDGDGGWN
jgi:hypothetical protein